MNKFNYQILKINYFKILYYNMSHLKFLITLQLMMMMNANVIHYHYYSNKLHEQKHDSNDISGKIRYFNLSKGFGFIT